MRQRFEKDLYLVNGVDFERSDRGRVTDEDQLGKYRTGRRYRTLENHKAEEAGRQQDK
jgi:hypothetical protein